MKLESVERIQQQAIRKQRRKIANLCRQGVYPLRVWKSETGYRLGVQRGKTCILVSEPFEKESHALLNGEAVYGQTARRLMKKSA